MKLSVRRILPIALLVISMNASAQFYKFHGGSISVGGTGQFTTPLTTNPSSGTAYNVTSTAGGVLNENVTNAQQFTTESAGFQFHPVAWAGIEMNYGFTHYSERYTFDYSSVPATTQRSSITTDSHEFTGAYQFHPKKIPFQPFVNIGGGAIDFTPNSASNQWRGAGLLEVGFDLPVHYKHIGFRIEGRSLYYRAPNFYTSAISTRGWRVTEEPSVSTYYRF
jgi:hypothetical protein